MDKILIDNSFKSFITDPGINLSHPKKGIIVLEDIFVFPELKCPPNKVISSKELLDINKNGEMILIQGPEDSGKTTLVKVLIRNYLEAGLYPVYIDAQIHGFSDFEGLVERIEIEYLGSYSEDIYSQIHTQSIFKKAIFIDNLDKLNSSSVNIPDIICNLHNLFGIVILTERTAPNSTFDTHLLSIYPELNTTIDTYEILEFNDELRMELIERWNNIGHNSLSDIEDNATKLDKISTFIDKVIGHNLVPSYPIYLLTILQMDKKEELSASESSYSYYYEYLIIKSLQKSIDKENLDYYTELLSEISFYIFKEQREEISNDELLSLFDKNKPTNRSYTDTLQILLQADMLSKNETQYNFRYKYAYHYFVAKYLSENIKSQTIKDIIKNLCSELNNDEYANIVLFITHLTDDSFMINELSYNAEFIFTDIENFTFEEDSSEIDKLITELSRLGDKDRKLKEDIVVYSGANHISDTQNKRRSLKAASNMIRIIRQVIRKYSD